MSTRTRPKLKRAKRPRALLRAAENGVKAAQDVFAKVLAKADAGARRKKG